MPGPGQYNTHLSPILNHRRSAAFSVGTSKRIDLANSSASKWKPGPGNYDVSGAVSLKKSAPAFGFGSEVRPALGKAGNSPAPGTYEAKNIIGSDGPSKTMGPRLKEIFKTRLDKLNPGPGQYDINARAMKTAPNFGFGTSKREDPRLGDKKITTDPGAYNPSITFSKTGSPMYRIGTE